MPRLDDKAVKAALLHPDAQVRDYVLCQVGGSYRPDPDLMTRVIEAIALHGRDKAFHRMHNVCGLAQTAETVAWAIEELKAAPRDASPYYFRSLSDMLCEADPRLVQPHEATLLASPVFADCKEQLSRRVRYLSWDGDSLWRELEAICEEGKDVDFASDMRWDEGADVADALGMQGERHASRILELLAVKGTEKQGNPLVWMEPLAVRVAGRMRLEAVVPLLVPRLHENDESVLIECELALSLIGSDAVGEALRSGWANGDFGYRLSASSVLEHIRTEASLRLCLELLQETTARDDLDNLCLAISRQFSTEGNEAVRDLYRKHGVLRESRDAFLASCTLMNQDFPELAAWRQEAELDMAKVRRRMAELELPAASPRPAPLRPIKLPSAPIPAKLGRNDPCPCGSGKKFKKCCMDREVKGL